MGVWIYDLWLMSVTRTIFNCDWLLIFLQPNSTHTFIGQRKMTNKDYTYTSSGTNSQVCFSSSPILIDNKSFHRVTTTVRATTVAIKVTTIPTGMFPMHNTRGNTEIMTGTATAATTTQTRMGPRTTTMEMVALLTLIRAGASIPSETKDSTVCGLASAVCVRFWLALTAGGMKCERTVGSISFDWSGFLDSVFWNCTIYAHEYVKKRILKVIWTSSAFRRVSLKIETNYHTWSESNKSPFVHCHIMTFLFHFIWSSNIVRKGWT